MPGVEVNPESLRRLIAALLAESDGKALKRDLVRELRGVATPARDAARTAVLASPVHGRQRREPGMRATVAARTVVAVRTTGKRPGVSVRVGRTGMPRGFKVAGRAMNRGAWRHPFFGNTERWYDQESPAKGWFDDTLPRFKEPAKAGAKRALDEVAKRISRSTKG